MAQIVTDDQLQVIDEFLTNTDYVPIMQTPNWVKVKAGWKADYLLEQDSAGKTLGYANLLSVHDAKRGGRFYYLPRGPLLADLADYDTAYKLVALAYETAKENGGKQLLIDPAWVESAQTLEMVEKLAAAFPGGRADTESLHLPGQPKLEMILDLKGHDYDSWLASIPSRRRSYVRRTHRLGVTTEISTDPALLDPLYRLIEETSERQQISHRPRSYFEAMLAAYPDQYFFCTASHEGHLYSISLNLAAYGQVHNLYIGNDLSNPKLYAPLAGSAATIREALDRGCRYVGLTGVYGRDRSDALYHYKIELMPKDQEVTSFVGAIEYDL